MTFVGLDSNVLAYAARLYRVPADEPKIAVARGLLNEIRARATLVAPVQALGEVVIVMRRIGLSYAQAQDGLVELTTGIAAPHTQPATLFKALQFAARHRFQFWDSVILTACQEAGCDLLLSEDMQHGFQTGGLTIVNPFTEPTHPLLAALR